MALLIKRSERLAPWIAGLVLAAPILFFRYPPMGDLPMHEALVALLRHRNDPAWAPPGMYYVVAPQANQLFHFLAYVLSFVFETALACKVVVAGTVLLTLVSAARLLDHLHVSRWPSLLVGPIVCGWMFRWGLAPNLLGFALFVFSLPLLERLAKRPSPRMVAKCALASCAIFFAHESSAVIFAMVAGYFAIVRGGGLRAMVARCTPGLATLLLAVVQLRLGRALAGANMRSIGNDYGLDPIERLAILPGAVFGGYDPTRLAVMSGVWLVALAVNAVAKGKPSARELPIRLALWRHRYPVLAAIFFFTFLGFPMALAGNTLLSHRFLPAACLFLIVACTPRTASSVRALLVAIVPVTMVGVELKSFTEADRRYRDLDEILAHLPNNVAIAQLDLTARPASLIAPVPGAASRALSEHGGRMLFALTDMPPNPVYVRERFQWNEPVLRMANSPYSFMPAHDGQRFAYLLARGTQPRVRALAALALEPEGELIASKGEWDLFRSRLPVDPIDSPDRPLPSPRPETLAARVNRLAAPPGLP
jgi:hypothetical protein